MKLRFRRVYPGRYEAKLRMMLDGQAADVTVWVRHMPEWSGHDKWAVEVEGRYRHDPSYSFDIVNLTDIIAHTKAEAIAYVQASIDGGGWTHGRFGWHAKV